jgi:hypothetical protein
MTTKLTDGGRRLARGDTYDYEDSRMTSRLQTAGHLLSELTGPPFIAHADEPGNQTVEFGRPKHQCTYRCTTSWSPELSDEAFNAAFALADALITKRGELNRARALKEES